MWTEKPTSKTLLDFRLQQGWTPTPTETQFGTEVMGYAACLTKPAS